MEKIDSPQKNKSHNIVTVPNIITTGRILGSCALIYHLFRFGLTPGTLFGVTSPWILPLAAVGIVATDFIDGFIARKFHCQSEFGEALDPVADKVFNWGIALSVALTGIMPIASLALFAPTLMRDLYVLFKTAQDKVRDGKKKWTQGDSFEEEKISHSKKRSKAKEKRGETKPGFWKSLARGDAMPPTIVGKLKMWPMSIAMISGLRYGFTIASNSLFLPLAVVTNTLSLVDMVLVHKNAQKRQEQRERELEVEFTEPSTFDSSKNKDLELDREYTLPEPKKDSSKKRTPSQIAYVEAALRQMEEDPSYAPSLEETGTKGPYQKK